jgi:hypothetical protein
VRRHRDQVRVGGGPPAREHAGPFGEPVTVSRPCLDSWIRAWRSGGFDALTPPSRQVTLRCRPRPSALAAVLEAGNPSSTAARVPRVMRLQRLVHPWRGPYNGTSRRWNWTLALMAARYLHQERYRRIVKRCDKLRALVVARSLLVIIWHLIRRPVAHCHEPGSRHADRTSKACKTLTTSARPGPGLRRCLPPRAHDQQLRLNRAPVALRQRRHAPD